MSRASDVWNEVRKIREHKAFYAVAGAGDAAITAVRGLPEQIAKLQSKADLAAVTGRAVEYVMVAGARAVQMYDELAERGMQVVGPPPTHQASALEYRASGNVVRGQLGNQAPARRPAAAPACEPGGRPAASTGSDSASGTGQVSSTGSESGANGQTGGKSTG